MTKYFESLQARALPEIFRDAADQVARIELRALS